MHAIHPDPRRAILVALAALVLTAAALAFPAAVGELDLRLGGDGSRSSAQPATAAHAERTAGEPRWVRDPLSPPGLVITR